MIEQWAVQFLSFIFIVLGVNSLPESRNQDWQVIEKWINVDKQHAQLRIESASLVAVCKANPEYYIVFPQNYLGKQEVFLDEVLLYTNSTYGWNLMTVFDRPSVSCHSVRGGSKLIFRVTSHFKYYASIDHYPEVVSGRPMSQPLYNVMFLVSAAICLSLCFIGEVFFRLLDSKSTRYNFLFLGFFSAAVMLVHVPGYFLDLDVKYTHILIYSSLMGMGLSFLYPRLRPKLSSLGFNFLLAGIGGSVILAFTGPNTAHMVMILGMTVAISAVIWVTIFFSGLSVIERIMHLLVSAMSLNDFYKSQATRSGAIYLTLLCVVLVVTAFISVFQELLAKKNDLLAFAAKLDGEKNLVEKVSRMNSLHRQIIHDLKGPITSLDFILKSEKANPAILNVVNSRLNEILKRSESEDSTYSLDWYTEELLHSKLDEIIFEKRYSHDFKIVKTIIERAELGRELFFDPIDLKIILDELILNSLKYNSAGSKFMELSITAREEHFCLTITDIGSKISDDVASMLGDKGVTTAGTGLGLYGIRLKVDQWGGKISFKALQSGLEISLLIKSRSNKQAFRMH